MRYRSFAISFLAAIGLFLQVIPAQVAISLPQGGSYRAGALMPVHVKLDGKTPADQELTLVADGALPTTLRMRGVREATATLLVLSSNLQRLRVIDSNGQETAVALPLVPDTSEPNRAEGARSAIAGDDAYAPTFSWRAGMDPSRRARVVQVGFLIAIVSLACALLRGRRAIAALLVVAAIASSVIAVWQRGGPELDVAGSAIIIEGQQVDQWRYFTTRSASPVHCSAPLRPGALPVFIDTAQAQAIQARLVCDAASGEVAVEAWLSRGQKLATLERSSADASAPAQPNSTDQTSPMLELARRLYVDRDTTIVGTVAPEPDPAFPNSDRWPAVVLRRR